MGIGAGTMGVLGVVVHYCIGAVLRVKVCVRDPFPLLSKKDLTLDFAASISTPTSPSVVVFTTASLTCSSPMGVVTTLSLVEEASSLATAVARGVFSLATVEAWWGRFTRA